jgi:hypothetical protein
MPYWSDPTRQAGLVARLAGVAMGLLALITGDVPGGEADQGTGTVIYREGEDPSTRVLGRAGARIFSDDPKDYTAEESDRGLRELDQAIATRPDLPQLHWYRYLTLDRMKRTAEARRAREEAIRLARIVPGGDDLLPEYYREHAEACAKEGDAPAAAAALLARLDLTPDGPELYESVAIWLGDNRRGKPGAPGPGRLFRGRERLEALWGPLDQFFERHSGPTDAQALEQVAKRISAGMDYREVARVAGFPTIGFGFCPPDHGVPVMGVCWRYDIQQPTIVRQGNLIGAIPPTKGAVVHVVIADGVVLKVVTLERNAPEDRPHRHGERASFDCGGPIQGMACSPDGMLIATGDMNGRVHLREARDGRELLVLRPPGTKDAQISGYLMPIAFAPGGKTLAAAGTCDATARLWHVTQGRLLANLESFPVPKDRGRMDHVVALAFSPDGKMIATVGYDRDLRLWDVANGRLRASLQGHSDKVTAVAYSPDGKTIATGDYDGTIRLWDAGTLRPKARWPGYASAVLALVFSPDRKTLAVGRGHPHGYVRLRDLTTDRWRATLDVGASLSPVSIAFAPDGKTVAVADAFWRVATLWECASGRRIGVLEGHKESVTAVAFSPDGRKLTTGSEDGTLKLWETPLFRDQDRVRDRLIR